MEELVQKDSIKSYLGMIVILGSIWGLSEAALGMGLRKCAASVSGSLMTGAALFFITAGWVVSKRISAVILMVLIAACFKLFDALLLSLPINHGAIGNPIFAFIMEAAAFLLFIHIIKEKVIKKPAGQALFGGAAALLAANLFPLVKFATGVPACVVQGTAYPLSLYYVHFAVLTSVITVPVGFYIGAKLRAYEARFVKSPFLKKFNYVLSPGVLVLCLVFITLLRLI
jgi:hypothetical protein